MSKLYIIAKVSDDAVTTGKSNLTATFSVVYNFAGSPVLSYKEVLSATLFSFLSSDNSALSCVAVDCLMALVDLIGLMSEKEVSFISVEVSLFKAS